MSGPKTDQKTTNEKPVKIHLDFREASLENETRTKRKEEKEDTVASLPT